jgi:hypothetical protein
MYHDKRFQKDSHFPLIAFNHEQIKESTTAGYLLAEKPKFDNISKRLLDFVAVGHPCGWPVLVLFMLHCIYCSGWARYPSSSMVDVIFRRYMNFSIKKCSNDMIIVYS